MLFRIMLTVNLLRIVICVGWYLTGVIPLAYLALDSLNPVCFKYECCTQDAYFTSSNWVTNNATRLQRLLDESLFGQHVATKILNKQLASFLLDEAPIKPFVLHISGKTGTGKNHIANLIAKTRYIKGVESKFVLKIIATHEYATISSQDAKQRLKKQVLDHVKKCVYSIVIVDEAEKLPEGTLNSIGPFLDINTNVDGIDFRKTIFIFLSNTAGNLIRDYTKKQLDSGTRTREDITVLEMEKLIQEHLYNSGELKYSSIISRYQLDAFIPMLPLERRHTKQCAIVQMNTRASRCGCGSNDKCISERADQICNELDFVDQFSRSGCKKIATKVNLICPIERQKRREL